MTEHAHEGAICKWCGLDYDFDLPSSVADACKRGDLVIFAGAGVSTEVSSVFPATFYSEMKAQAMSSAESFPQVMADYESKFSRTDLVRALKARLDMADSLPTLRRAARQFHQELSSIPFIRDIITTNWDTYFEEECLATPFVVGEDMAFAGMYSRRVFKMHGSISNVSTLVATEDDYQDSLNKFGENALGARVRDLLATKTVAFVGYSMSDWNFQRLYQAIRADMGKFAPQAFIVTPEDVHARSPGLTHLRTSGVKFVRELKSALGDQCLIEDTRLDAIVEIEDRAFRAERIAKEEYSHRDYPAVLFTWMYIEGVTDACFRIRHHRGSGAYSDAHRVQAMAHRYLRDAERANDLGRFHDAAYLGGYANVLLTLFIDEGDVVEDFPYFFVYGSDDELTRPSEFKAALEQSRRRAPKQRAYARRMLGDLPADMILTHDRSFPDFERMAADSSPTVPVGG